MNLDARFDSPPAAGRTGRRAFCLLLACLLAVAAPSVHAADTTSKDTPPAWQAILALQLKDQYRCDLDKVLFDRDVEVGSRKSKEGRARCVDGREFDFSRDGTHEKFTLQLCSPTVC